MLGNVEGGPRPPRVAIGFIALLRVDLSRMAAMSSKRTKDYIGTGITKQLGFTKEDIKQIMRDSMKLRAGHVDAVRDREMIQDFADFNGISFEAAQKHLQDAIDSLNGGQNEQSPLYTC